MGATAGVGGFGDDHWCSGFGDGGDFAVDDARGDDYFVVDFAFDFYEAHGFWLMFCFCFCWRGLLYLGKRNPTLSSLCNKGLLLFVLRSLTGVFSSSFPLFFFRVIGMCSLNGEEESLFGLSITLLKYKVVTCVVILLFEV